jgi:3-hydroxyacyl-CoA dehydrogenase
MYHISGSPAQALSTAEYVVEAVPEDEALKKASALHA